MSVWSAELASCSTPRSTYHVFLSFRGEDTRKAFTDHLYTALLGAGFCTFRDDDGIERCENVKSELDKAITEARSSIVVFSKDYASSGCCLDELVMILERRRALGHVILPVFYDVDPTEVRKQTGSFAKAFYRHEERVKAETNERMKECLRNKVQGWRTALGEVADLAGMVLQNQADGHESKFIQKIIKVIGDKLNRPVLHVAPYIIGMESRVKEINTWLQHESADVDIAVIYGMGGAGKTTLAKCVYNLNFGRFEASSFLANIRESSEGPNGLVRLQGQLLSDILKRKKEKICNVAEGNIKIKDANACKRVFLVLDDVDQRDQFDALIGMRDWLHPGSKIILTTRYKHLLKPHEAYKMHEIERFDDGESFELFSWHAFGQDHPIKGYVEHSKRIVRLCGGLPLALQVLGSSLSGKSLDIWNNALQKLKVIPNSQILKKLKICYDCLQDDHDRNLFLHIACFFIGKGKNFTIRILDECEFYPTIGIQNLIDRCLLTIEDNKLMMHQLLRDMGREIVRQESPKQPGKRSRLWHHKDSFNVLREETGTETIEGLFLDMHLFEEATSFGANDNAKQRRFEALDEESLLAHGFNSPKWLRFFSWHLLNTSIRNSNHVELKTDAFAGMRDLRLLQLNYVEIKGGYKDFPKELRWLCWHGCPLKSIPSEFYLNSLIALDLHYSKLEKVWKGTKFLRLLKILNLSYSYGLMSTPDFTGLPNLEDLVLKDCIKLVEVHKSLGKLQRLVSLNLKGCKNLKKLPGGIGHLISLEKLIISGCSKLDQLPDLGKLKSLKVLLADGVSINRTPTKTSEDKSWSLLFLSWVLKPRNSPESLSFSLASLPCSLVSLSLRSCNLSNDNLVCLGHLSILEVLDLSCNLMSISFSLASLPCSLVSLHLSNCNLSNDNLAFLGHLSMLEVLDLKYNPISSLPESIKGLTVLMSLLIQHCERLESLPELPMSLWDLDVHYCPSLERVTNLPNLLTSLHLLIFSCDKLVEAQGMFKLEPIGNADAEMVNYSGCVKLESMGNLEVELYNRMTLTTKISSLLGLYECGIYNIYFPGSKVPSWCSYKRSGSSVSFSMPSLCNLQIRALNIYVIYAYAHGYDYEPSYRFHYIKINNKTKGLKWVYSPTFEGQTNDEMVWFSHWKIGNQFILEGSDGVEVSANVDPWFYQVKEVGVEIVYEESGRQHHDAYPSHHNVGDLSAYCVGTGSYYLCHHDHGCHRDFDFYDMFLN